MIERGGGRGGRGFSRGNGRGLGVGRGRGVIVNTVYVILSYVLIIFDFILE